MTIEKLGEVVKKIKKATSKDGERVIEDAMINDYNDWSAELIVVPKTNKKGNISTFAIKRVLKAEGLIDYVEQWYRPSLIDCVEQWFAPCQHNRYFHSIDIHYKDA